MPLLKRKRMFRRTVLAQMFESLGPSSTEGTVLALTHHNARVGMSDFSNHLSRS